jgi:ubiquinone/menaquinone biosynthesis C-methylase UbiE
MIEPKDKKAVKQWWAENPQTYGDIHGVTEYSDETGTHALDFSSREFFDRVDQTFYSWNRPLHDATGYFGKIFPYEKFAGKKVMEIGCGMGTMSMNWAQHGAIMHAMDLNPKAVSETTARFRTLGLVPRIVQGDANVIPFPDNSFDYLYSWGVLHHSPDLDRSISEVFRVLRPGGEFGIMLYHRSSFLYWYFIRWMEGYLNAESKFLTTLQLASRYTDGDKQEGNPHTWPVTKPEMRRLFQPYCAELGFQVMGLEIDAELFQIMPLPALARAIPIALRKPLARRWGWSLWIYGKARG